MAPSSIELQNQEVMQKASACGSSCGSFCGSLRLDVLAALEVMEFQGIEEDLEKLKDGVGALARQANVFLFS